MPTGERLLQFGQFLLLLIIWLELRSIGRTLKMGKR